jgi:hypothetical protein
LPSAQQATEIARNLTGSWSTAELPHRVSQKFVEHVLRRHAAAQRTVSIHILHSTGPRRSPRESPA